MVDKLTNIIIPKYKLKYKIQRNKNIIQASLDKNIKLPFSCRSGICGTCKAKIINGEVSINNNYYLYLVIQSLEHEDFYQVFLI